MSAYIDDENPITQRAMQFAGDMAGEFIDEIGQTDMAKWSQEQWQGLIGVICTG